MSASEFLSNMSICAMVNSSMAGSSSTARCEYIDFTRTWGQVLRYSNNSGSSLVMKPRRCMPVSSLMCTGKSPMPLV